MLSENVRARVSTIFFFIDMILFGLAIGFLDASTVIPEFVGQATDSKVLVGLSGIMFTLFWRLPQLAFAPAANRSQNKRRWMLISALPGRISFFGVALVAVAVGRDNPGLMLLVFFLSYGLFAMMDGITALVWVELIGAAVPDKTRGMMFSGSQIVAGVLVLGVQGILRNILGKDGPGYPNNYAVVFIIAAGLLTLSVFFLINVNETRDAAKARNIELKDYLPYLRTLLVQDRPFRNFLIMRFFMEAAFYLATPFYIGYEIEQLRISSAQAVSDSLIAVTLGGLGGSILATVLSRRYSSRVIIWLMMIAVLAGPSLALISPVIGYGALLVTFFSIGLVHSTGAPGLLNWLIAYPEPGNRPVYSGIANTLGIAALIAPVAGGVILQITNYPVLFVFSLALAIFAAFTASRLVDPNAHRALTHAPYPVPDV